jgi:heme A synthase
VLGEFHSLWGYAVIIIDGIAGLGALGFAAAKRSLPPLMRRLVVFALAASGLQVLLGVVLYADGERPGSIHVFYGVLTAVAITFAYIYRSELNKRPELRWGLLLLFMMGLAIRATFTYGT